MAIVIMIMKTENSKILATVVMIAIAELVGHHADNRNIVKSCWSLYPNSDTLRRPSLETINPEPQTLKP